jgi:hypothetical protein
MRYSPAMVPYDLLNIVLHLGPHAEMQVLQQWHGHTFGAKANMPQQQREPNGH